MASHTSEPILARDHAGSDAVGDTPAIAAIYRDRGGRFARERDRLTARWNQVANLRLLSFAAAVVCLGWALWSGVLFLVFPGGFLLVCFVLLVIYHRRLDHVRQQADVLWRINDEAGKRLARAWEDLPQRHTAHADPGHPYASDLDIVGHASLLHLLETVSTVMGETTLRRWLLSPASPATVRQRQAAGSELAPLLDFRQQLLLRGRLTGDTRPDPEPFLRWAEGERWLPHRQTLRWTARIGPVLLWSLLVLWLAGVVPYPFWLIFLLLNGAISRLSGGVPYRILAQVAEQEGAFGHYADSFQLVAAAPFTTPMLKELQSDLTAGGVAAYERLRWLQRLRTLVIPRSSLAYGIMQPFTLWDIHLLAALERWQAVAGGCARGWLSALGEVETLAAFGSLAHDNPGWCYPDLDPRAETLAARDLGHPLLPENIRVVNDVTVGPVGTFLLVTGSNMSGKSTLLRAIGVNVALANAGGPVCARAFRLPPVALWTSMRIQDSLERGVSYFMAELQRLKQVVDAARPEHRADHRVVLYLLDEILQGTNTAERQIAARRIIHYLVARNALGAVSTHDLDLADPDEAPEIAVAARPVHFTETLTTGPDGPVMSFDYRLRPGIATSTNALSLMEIMGLTLDVDGASARRSSTGRLAQ